MYGNYGGAIFVIALGAILKWAVTGHLSAVSLATIGVILMLAGLAWLLLALLYDFGTRRHDGVRPFPARERIVERDEPVL